MWFSFEDVNHHQGQEVLTNPNDIVSPFIYGTYLGLNLSYNLFLLYCVANTIAPTKTKNFLLNSAWYGLELYTIIELTFKERCIKFQDDMIKKYPWLSLNKWKQIIEQNKYIRNTESIKHFHTNTTNNNSKRLLVDQNGDIMFELNTKEICNNHTENVKNVEDARLILIRDNNSEYYKVIDTFLDKKNLTNNEHTNDKHTETTHVNDITDDMKLKFSFLACSIVDENKKNWDIKLCRNDTCYKYNFYTLGNILLSKEFLLFFIKTYIDANKDDKHNLINSVKNDKYTINIIDNKANMITWNGSNKAIELHSNGPIVFEWSNIITNKLVEETETNRTHNDSEMEKDKKI